MSKEIKKELVGQCFICHKDCYRGDGESHLLWYYHVSRGFVCCDHEGVEEWYMRLLNEEEEK